MQTSILTGGVAFDLEGTIVNIEHIHHQGHILATKEVNVILDLGNLLEVVCLIPHFIGGPREIIVEEIFHLSDGTYSRDFITERDKYHYQSLLQQETDIKPRDGFIDILEQLRELDIETSIGSVTSRGEALFLLGKSGLDNFFNPDRIVLREDVARPKPYPDVYQKTAEIMDIEPHRQLVIGDSLNDALASKAAGSLFIAMPIYYDELFIRQGFEEVGAIGVYKEWNSLKGMFVNDRKIVS